MSVEVKKVKSNLEEILNKVDYDSFCNWVQLLRSKGANLRTEMQLANIT